MLHKVGSQRVPYAVHGLAATITGAHVAAGPYPVMPLASGRAATAYVHSRCMYSLSLVLTASVSCAGSMGRRTQPAVPVPPHVAGTPPLA